MIRPLPFDPLLRLSLRTRLVLLTVALLTVGLATSTIVVNNLLRGYLQGRIDSQLRPAAALFGYLPVSLAPDSTATPGPLPQGAASRVAALNLVDMPAIVYLDPAGHRVGALDLGAKSTGPGLPVLDRAAVARRGGRPFTVAGHGGGPRWRVVVEPLAESADRPHLAADQRATAVAVAIPMGKADATVDGLWAISAGVAAALLTVLTAASRLAVRSGLRPLTRIEHTATAIAAGDMSHRVPTLAGPHTEVGRLATVINAMLTQIETAFAARAASEATMRRFVADASHELRTPLVGIKGYTQLYRMGLLSTPEDIDRTMDRIADEADRLARLVDGLLQLARLDEAPHHQGIGSLQLAPTDLRTLAVDALHDVRALDPTRPVQLTGPGGGAPTAAAALTDEAALRQVVTNLVGNAVTHTPAGTPVRIGVGAADGHAVLEVSDDGPGLTADQAAMAFERFYRADSARTHSNGVSAGLGLAIVKSIITAHHGRVELTTAPDQGATFRILLPEATK